MRVNNARAPSPLGLTVVLLSLIGAVTVLRWIHSLIPESIGAALAEFNHWMTTPQAAPIDIVGFGMLIIIVFVVLSYPAFMRA